MTGGGGWSRSKSEHEAFAGAADDQPPITKRPRRDLWLPSVLFEAVCPPVLTFFVTSGYQKPSVLGPRPQAVPLHGFRMPRKHLILNRLNKNSGNPRIGIRLALG